MTGREFLAMWMFVLGVTAAIVGWVTLCCAVIFPRTPWAAMVLSIGPILGAMMVGMWMVVRD